MTSVSLPVQDLWDWFLEETGSLLRRLPLRRAAGRFVCVDLGTKGRLFPAKVQAQGSGDPEIAESASQLADVLDRLSGKQPLKCRIRVATGHFVARTLAPLRLPRSRAMAMARTDLAANTPFSPADVHILLSARDETVSDSAYCLVKSSELDPVVQAVCRRGRIISALEFHTPGRVYRADRLGLRPLNPKRLVDRIRLGLAAALAMVMIGSAAGLYGLADDRLQSAERALDAQIAEARKSAGEARHAFEAHRRRMQQMSSLKSEKTLTGSTVYAWEQLSRVLPDDTWLSDLVLEEGAVTLTGLSASAAKLIPLLEKDAAFEAPEFQSAVMKVPGQDVERFSLRMRLKPQEPNT